MLGLIETLFFLLLIVLSLFSYRNEIIPFPFSFSFATLFYFSFAGCELRSHEAVEDETGDEKNKLGWMGGWTDVQVEVPSCSTTDGLNHYYFVANCVDISLWLLGCRTWQCQNDNTSPPCREYNEAIHLQ